MSSKLIHEPLVHFLIGALLVFAFFGMTGLDRSAEDYAIQLDESDVGQLAAGWVQNFRRPPTEQELNSLIDQEIREEIYYREALRLGMNANDVVIRRRLANKMKFLHSEEGAEDNPSDTVLQKWLDDHAGKYALSSRYDFEQVYLGEGDDFDPQQAEKQAAELNEGSLKADRIRKPLSLPVSLKDAEDNDISRQFGEKFAATLAGSQTGEWTGPIPSGFGFHLVRITAKKPGKVATLDQVRQAVTNDWRAAQTSEREESAYQELLRQYDVQVAGRK